MQEEASRFAAFVGIDWADRKHDVCLQVPGATNPEASVLEHRPTVIDAWARRLRDRFGGRPIAVCVELAQAGKMCGQPGREVLPGCLNL